MQLRSITTFLAATAFLFTVGSTDAFAKKNKDSGEAAPGGDRRDRHLR
ncbi:MAG: hypothetical protein IPK67_19620 [Planctomycetes bacterium]|nr:hypothetical protein [Planctomycetota bacterium]